ncbi:phosphatase PAP2 family protein [Streptomyces iconiensis]|uniref:Phosphatase PAP2 family protein n=2 Tax=Streptomyces iconiensis TaxID=1384038 RepID=A0ABT6ZU64_9ACTN|nr:phosphatase PAP2 family protein [Streptomyces iconiensis]MDJ1132599.1 phosphatase PAP2 family protein [Streptomyces iconiensis]
MAAAVSVLKAWVGRPGPFGGTGFYPSGHAATVTVAFGAAALLVTRHLSRNAALFLWSAVALLTVGNGLGLVWRGYHWPLDVLASWCLSVLLLSSAAVASRHTPPLSGRRRSTAPGRG